MQAYCAPGDEVLFPQYGFIKYELAARAFGTVPVRAPEVDLVANVDNLLAAVSERTRVLFLANPNNPTGTYLPDSEIGRLRASLREDILLVIDAAYAEFVDRPDYSDEHEERARAHNARAVPWLAERLSDIVEVVPSVCNFLLLRFKDASQCERAKAALARSSVLAMGLTGYGLPEALRVTVGNDAANAAVVEAIRGVIE